MELSSARGRATEPQEQLSSEDMVVAELKSELAQTKLELETTLKAQHKHLKDLEAVRRVKLPCYKSVLCEESGTICHRPCTDLTKT